MNESEMFKMTLNYLLMEENELSDMWTEYNEKIATFIIRFEPKDEVEYKIATLQAEVENQQLLNKIHKKQNLINGIEKTLQHPNLMLEDYKKFEKENEELFEILNKLFGDD